MGISRRNFLKLSGGAGAGVIGLSGGSFPRWMPKMAFSPAGQEWRMGERDVLVCVFLRGGMDSLNVVVPFGEGANYYDRRPSIAIPEPGGSYGAALDLDGFFGLHPALSPLHDIYTAGGLTVVHSAGSPDPTRSHFDAMEYMERGIPGDRMTGTGWITRHLQSAAWVNDSPFRAVGMGAMVQGSMRGPVSALALQSITDFHLGGRDDQLGSIQRTLAALYNIEVPADMLSAQAGSVMNTVDLLSRLSADEYAPANDAIYPDTDFGMGLRQVAQLIKADVGLEVACVDLGGWDTHEDQGGADGEMAYHLEELGGGLAAFHSDMGEGMQNVTVVTMSEFGRTATENASGGTDHGRAGAMFVMGGGATGTVHARWNGLSDEALDEGDLAVTTDYRDVLSEIVTRRILNPDVASIFPGYAPNAPDIIRARS